MTINVLFLKAQDTTSRTLQFLAPESIDSLTCELFSYFDSIGVADDYLVQWRISSFPDYIWEYHFYEIPKRSEFDSAGHVSNRGLWLKNRTERELKLSCGYRVPLISQYDMWAYLDGDKEVIANMEIFWGDRSLYILKKQTNNGQVVMRRWRFSRDDNGNKVLINLWEDEEVKIK